MADKKKGSKLLITGFERTGKSKLTSGLTDALVIAVDDKPYPFDVPHYKLSDYKGINAFKEEFIEMAKKYKEMNNGVGIKTVVIDTVTKLYEKIYKYSSDNFSGFDLHASVSKETLAVNKFIEEFMIGNGVNVVVVAHVVFDSETNRHIVPATGQFAKTGSWLSIVDDASYIFLHNGKLMIAHNNFKYPCRTTLDMPREEKLDEYNINEHLAKLEAKASHNKKFSLN